MAPGERFNLILPGSAVGGELPLLHAAGISFVFIDQNEAYKIPGRSQVGIGKNALDRIAASLAEKIKWIRTLREAWGNRLVQIEFMPREISQGKSFLLRDRRKSRMELEHPENI